MGHAQAGAPLSGTTLPEASALPAQPSSGARTRASNAVFQLRPGLWNHEPVLEARPDLLSLQPVYVILTHFAFRVSVLRGGLYICPPESREKFQSSRVDWLTPGGCELRGSGCGLGLRKGRRPPGGSK